MWVVRAVQLNDLEPLLELVQTATQGLTTLQLDRTQLLDRIEQSVFAFSRTSPSPAGEPYVLVLVDQQTSEIAGTSTVFAKTGGYQPFYSYRLVTSEHRSEQLAIHQKRTRLELQRVHDGPTEIGSLFLRRKHRGGGRGRWLSLARFALIAMRPQRFADRVIAEMRGHTEPDGTVPFWEALAGRFIPVDFATADTMSTVCKQFIEEMMPTDPIYLSLLPEQVSAQIGQVHIETLPALRFLEREGFRRTEYVDIFDGGPQVSCPRDQIRAVQRSHRKTVAKFEELSSLPEVLVASSRDGFTSVLSPVRIDGPEIVMPPQQADVLGLEIGDSCTVLGLVPS